MGTFILWSGIGAILTLLLVLYIRLNDRRLRALPDRITTLSQRMTPESVRKDADEFAWKPAKDIKTQLPPRTGRRYVVVGGGGFLGGWIVQQMLERGEDPHNIRVLDLSETPANYAVSDAKERGLLYLKTDVSDPQAVETAFNHPWKDTSSGITVFHTAANIRFYEQHPIFLPRSARVNVEGIRNVLKASKKAGVDVLVYTSSGSINVKSTRLLLWPWEREPKHFVQVINDDTPLPTTHYDYFSNYAATKAAGDKLVQEADGTPTDGGSGKLRTGSIRPGNGIFGPRGDMLLGAYLLRKANPSWAQNIMQSLSYVENCALAHLLYERRLLDTIDQENKSSTKTSSRLPDIGGQSFVIADPGPILTYGDAYVILETLTNGECHFPSMSPTTLFLVSKLVEFYYITQHRLVSGTSSWPLLSSFLTRVMPPIQGDIINLQPPLFYLMTVHLIFDDSRARKSPREGGLGYEGVWSTFEGLYKTWYEYEHAVGGSTHNSRSESAGLSLGFRRKGKGKGDSGALRAKAEVASASAMTAASSHVVKEGIHLGVATPVEVSAAN